LTGRLHGGDARVIVAALLFAGCGASQGAGPPLATGTLELAGCVIAEGAASCPASIGWTTTNADAPRLLVGDATLSTAPAGRLAVPVTTAVQTVTLFDGNLALDEDVVRGACASASAWDGRGCRAYAERLDERIPTPFVEEGRPVSLEVVVFRPFGPGPFPALAFHHGSTGTGDDPSLFRLTYVSETVAQFFTGRGYLVAFPQRRGRGTSDGRYDEGFTPDRSRYSCQRDLALAGFERALQDVDVAVSWVNGRGDVAGSPLLSGGISRGGVLAVAHAGRRPGLFTGVVNFVGGWLGEGCSDAAVVNRSAFQAGAAFDRPTLWLYGENDSFYSLAHSRGNFDAFVAAGGQGAFLSYVRAPGLNGHFIVNDPTLWGADLDAYLRAVAR
jgi:dienelactone hydrolase